MTINIDDTREPNVVPFPKAYEPSPGSLGSLAISAPPEWWTTRPPRRKHLLVDPRKPHAPGVVPLGKTGMLVGEGGVSKTMAIVQLALSVATGTRWLGTFDVATPGKVLLILGEEDREETHRRIYHAAQAARVPFSPDIRVLALQGRPSALLCPGPQRGQLLETPDYAELLSVARGMAGLSLIVFDPLSRFAGPDAETDNAAATRFMQLVESFGTSTGATCLVAHHTAKAARGGVSVGSSASRGSSALTDGARFVCTLGHNEHKGLQDGDRERLERTVLLSFGKSNYTMLADALELRRSSEHMGALIPLDDSDLETVGAVAGTTDKSAARADALGLKYEAQEQAVRKIVADRMPVGISKTSCAELAKKACRCGSEAAWSAVKRAIAVGLIRYEFDDDSGNVVLP